MVHHGIGKGTEAWDELDDAIKYTDMLVELIDFARTHMISIALGFLVLCTSVCLGCCSCPGGQMVDKVSADIASLRAQEASTSVPAGPPSMNPLQTKGGDWTLNATGKATDGEQVKRVLSAFSTPSLSP